MAIKFYFADIKLRLNQKRRLKKHIENLFLDQGKNLRSLSYVFASDEYLLDINRNFLNHDYYTDVITFDLSSDENATEGEIYISVDRVRDNAKQISTDFLTELHRVMFHGGLHLCGYKDKSKKDRLTMRDQEDNYLAKFFN